MAFLEEKPCIAPSLFSRVHSCSTLAVLLPRLLHYIRTMPDPQKRIESLRKKRAAAKRASKDKLANLKDKHKAAEREQLAAIDKKIRGAESQLRGQARRDDTRRKILIGAALRIDANHNPHLKQWLEGDFPAHLIRDRDRSLFGLEPLAPAAMEPIPGFKPKTLPDQTWGARFTGDTSSLPAELVGRRILVTRSGGDSWTATVLEVVERTPRRLLVRRTDPPNSA